jgi:hypothetical protein
VTTSNSPGNSEQANASNTKTNASCYSSGQTFNAKQQILDFLESRSERDEYWCPTVLAKTLDLPRGTVSRCMAELVAKNKVFWIPKGKIHLYAATKRQNEDLARMMKLHQFTRKDNICVHGLSLTLKAKAIGRKDFSEELTNSNQANGTPPGGMSKVVHASFGVQDIDHTSFQLSRRSLTIYCGCSLKPMDYEMFVLWMAKVDVVLQTKQWPSLDANMKHWIIKQYGINKDGKVVKNDHPKFAASMFAFHGWLARVYEKDMPNGDRVLRQEVHSNEEKYIDDFVKMAFGSVNEVKTSENLPQLIESQNNVARSNQEIRKEIGKFKDYLNSSKFKGKNDSNFDYDAFIGNVAKSVESLRSENSQRLTVIETKLSEIKALSATKQLEIESLKSMNMNLSEMLVTAIQKVEALTTALDNQKSQPTVPEPQPMPFPYRSLYE